MGYQDRDYFRDEHRPYLDLIRSTRVCWGIVIVISLVFLATLFTQDTAQPLQDYLKLDPKAMIQDWQWHRLLTAVFVAEQPWHLAFALLVIWLIGHELEQLAGGRELLVFFLVSTLLSNLAVTLVYYYVPLDLRFRPPASFGPAGAAIALLAWAVFLSPQRVVTYLFVPMPFWLVGMLVLVFDLFFFMQRQPVTVKLAVHVLSLLFALSYSFFDWRLTSWPRWRGARRKRPARRQLTTVLQLPTRQQSVREELSKYPDMPTPAVRAVDEQLEAKLDVVLEKVSASGMQSLTEEEKGILKRASEVMKRRKS